MRKELWGLRMVDTKEPVYIYWASSNRHRALFVRQEEAERACLNPMNKGMEPFKITGADAGGPERQGCWEVHFDHWAPYIRCSVCGFEMPLISGADEKDKMFKHCPECTARMGKEDAQ